MITKYKKCSKLKKRGYYSSLRVRLDFKKKVTSENRESVEERITYDPEEDDPRYIFEENIAKYFFRKNFSAGTKFFSNRNLDYFFHEGTKTKCKLKPNTNKLCLEIKMDSEAKLDLDNLIDLDDLEKFVLSGK